MTPGGGGAHTGGDNNNKKTHNFVTTEDCFLNNMTMASAYLASWEGPQDPVERRTQVVAVQRGPCEGKDHPWGRAGVLEVVGPPSVDRLQVEAEDTHTHRERDYL